MNPRSRTAPASASPSTLSADGSRTLNSETRPMAEMLAATAQLISGGLRTYGCPSISGRIHSPDFSISMAGNTRRPSSPFSSGPPSPGRYRAAQRAMRTKMVCQRRIKN